MENDLLAIIVFENKMNPSDQDQRIYLPYV
jgi:hypothetical protein